MIRARISQRGISLVEIMLSMIVLAIAMLGLMKVASIAAFSNQRGQRMEQASSRAQARLEALQNVPTVTLECLSQGSTPATCVNTCTSGGGEITACQIALGLDTPSLTDSTNTAYNYGFLVQKPATNVYDILVVASFMDDAVDPPKNRRSIFRTAVYRTQ